MRSQEKPGGAGEAPLAHRGAALRCGGDLGDAAREQRRVAGGEQLARVADDLGQGRGVRGEHRRPAGHRLERGEAEAFVLRGNHREFGAAVEPRQVLVGDVAEQPDRRVEAAPAHRLGDFRAVPAGAPGERELERRPVRVLAPEDLEGVDEERDVLARLEDADEEQVAPGRGRVARTPAAVPPGRGRG